MSASLPIFKIHILALVRPISKSIFGIHESIYLKYLFQLQVGLSPLKGHKKSTPEDTYNFLLTCRHFAVPRLKLCLSLSYIWLYISSSL